MEIEEMKREIERFINQHWGTAIGESVRRELENAEDNAEWIEDIYKSVIEF